MRQAWAWPADEPAQDFVRKTLVSNLVDCPTLGAPALETQHTRPLNLVLRLPHSGRRPFVRFGHTRHRRPPR